MRARALLSLFAIAAPAGAQERVAHHGDCIALGVFDVVPAAFEVGPWLHAGGGSRDGVARASVGAGVEGTFGFARFGSGKRFELRAGPWVAAETPFDRVRGESGLSFLFGERGHAQWGTFGLRAGAGLDDRAVPHAFAGLSWGVRYVPARFLGERGVCDSPRKRHAFALASGARLFGTLRRGLLSAPSTELIFGLEFEPTWFLPPYSFSKWMGNPMAAAL